YNIRNNLTSSFILKNDLDFCNEGSYKAPGSYPGISDYCLAQGATNGWDPLGDTSDSFKGTFDGQNYTISNLFIGNTGKEYRGLIGYAKFGSAINNLGLIDVNISGSSFVGGLAGYNNGTISNSYATGVINADTILGGLIGKSEQNIEKSYFIGTVKGGELGSYTGGLVGILEGGSINNSYALVNVSINENYAGGLVGYCLKNAKISNSYSFVNVTGNLYVGGFIGGINQSLISNSYSEGVIISTSITEPDNVASFVGHNYQSSISNSYSTGPVYYSGPDPTDKGFVGRQNIGGGWKDIGNFFDINTSNQTSTTGNATGKTTTGMQNFSTFDNAGWDIQRLENWTNETWFIKDETDYPRLWWEGLPPVYSDSGYNSSKINESTLFSIKWNDEVALHPNGQWIFSTNNSGSWVNDSAVNFTETPEWANVTKILNETLGITIGYRGYAKDNDGKWNQAEIFTLVTSLGPDNTSPFYSNISHNNTTIYSPTLFSVLWNDERALNSSGQWIFSTNNSGSWVNDSAVNFTETPEWANVTKRLSNTPYNYVGYKWYASDNSGNWNQTEITTLSVEIPNASSFLRTGNELLLESGNNLEEIGLVTQNFLSPVLDYDILENSNWTLELWLRKSATEGGDPIATLNVHIVDSDGSSNPQLIMTKTKGGRNDLLTETLVKYTFREEISPKNLTNKRVRVQYVGGTAGGGPNARYTVLGFNATNGTTGDSKIIFPRYESIPGPTIPFVETISLQNPIEGNIKQISFIFTAENEMGVSELEDSTAKAYFQRIGETTRYNESCVAGSTSGNRKNYTCTIDMWYFDEAGDWTINVSIKNNAGDYAENSSTTFQYNELTAMVLSPTTLTWPSPLSLGVFNVTASNYLVINNTGNAEGLSVNITALDLVGLTNLDYSIFANNFSVDKESDGCSGTTTQNSTSINTSLILSRGNNSLNYQNETSGQGKLYFCLRGFPTNIASQEYSTSRLGPWEITILLVAIIPAKKQKRRISKKRLGEDKLFGAIDLILDELKEEYSLGKKEIIDILIEKLSKKYGFGKKDILKLIEQEKNIPSTIFSKELGALESLVGYMKENLNMSYKEISNILQRNERTIWTAYKKAKEKQLTSIKKKRDKGFLIPLSIFKNKKLTILESVILYMKQKGLKFIEIAELLERDQRNIWTVYTKAKEKISQ
ncbi:hypothetical protein K0A97_03125, partial [Patescibacteria group bacterium]|nr:hypothetical protein [Patescibacteria group bacterium]